MERRRASSPSGWFHRLAIVLLGALNLGFALHLALYQWGVIDRVWDKKILLGVQAESGWFAVSGFIDLLLGVLIWVGWPKTATWVIGLFVGIELLFAGFSLILLASAAKRLPPMKI